MTIRDGQSRPRSSQSGLGSSLWKTYGYDEDSRLQTAGISCTQWVHEQPLPRLPLWLQKVLNNNFFFLLRPHSWWGLSALTRD